MLHQIQDLCCRRQVQDCQIRVRDAFTAKQWYGEILGVRTHRYVAGWKTFVLGDIERRHQFTLVQGAQQAGTDKLVWRFENRDELWTFYGRAREMGVTIREVVDRSDSIVIYLRDPDGNRIEIHCNMPGAAAVRGTETWNPSTPYEPTLPWNAPTFPHAGETARQYAVAA
jgi:catechol-2,3-dioxygenase